MCMVRLFLHGWECVMRYYKRGIIDNNNDKNRLCSCAIFHIPPIQRVFRTTQTLAISCVFLCVNECVILAHTFCTPPESTRRVSISLYISHSIAFYPGNRHNRRNHRAPLVIVCVRAGGRTVGYDIATVCSSSWVVWFGGAH